MCKYAHQEKNLKVRAEAVGGSTKEKKEINYSRSPPQHHHKRGSAAVDCSAFTTFGTSSLQRLRNKTVRLIFLILSVMHQSQKGPLEKMRRGEPFTEVCCLFAVPLTCFWECLHAATQYNEQRRGEIRSLLKHSQGGPLASYFTKNLGNATS